MDDLSLRGHLDECEREIDRLREENRELRNASLTFGDLAERLNARLVKARVQNKRGRPDGPERVL